MAYLQSLSQKPSTASPSSVARVGRFPHRRSEAALQCGDTVGEHQLEKLEFALAVALTRGDLNRSNELRRQIDDLGGNHEEPGT